MRYDYLVPPRVLFGWGRRAEVGQLAKALGKRAFIVNGSRTLRTSGVLDEIRSSLADAGIEPCDAGTISREPQVEDVDRTVDLLRKRNVGYSDLVLGIGGGAALDLAKAAAALATNSDGASVLDYLEGVARGLQIEYDPLPVIAMPTTGGTGSEATKNAVISSENPPFKKSLRSDRMVPRVVLIDPELTVSVPPHITAWTGMDAITQLIESYISRRAQPIPQALAIQGLELATPAISEAFHNGKARAAREAMAHAAFLSGMALANSGLGMAHGFAASLGIHCGIAHGLACAMFLPVAMRTNREVREAELARLGCILSGKEWSTASGAVEAGQRTIERLCDDLKIPRTLSEIGVAPEKFPEIVRGSRGNSMDGNPRTLSDDELIGILESMR